MTFSDPAPSVPFSSADPSPFIDQGDGSTGSLGDVLGYAPTLPEVPSLFVFPGWLEVDPGSEDPQSVEGGTEDDPEFWIDPFPEAWTGGLPGPDGLIVWEDQDPGSENLGPWRGGDAPLPWWRGASNGGDGGEPLLYALDGVIDPGADPALDPELQVCFYSLGAPAADAADQDGDPVPDTASLFALNPAPWVAPALPQAPAPPTPGERGATPEAAAADETVTPSVDALLALTQSGTSGVDAPASWRDLDPAALGAPAA